MVRRTITALAISTLMGAQASAAGDAGCGLGSVIIQRNSKGLQLLAMTTNASTFTQFFGITSGTSNCSSSGLVQNDRQIEYFVEVNQQDLKKEMSQGKGEKLQVLANLSGCSTEASVDEFKTLTQKSYSNIVTAPNVTPSEMVSNLQIEMLDSGVCQPTKTN